MATTDITENFTTMVFGLDDANDNEKKKKLSFIIYIGCIVTILACLATSMAFIGYRLLRSVRDIIRMSFLGVLALGEVCYLAGLTLYSNVPAVCAITAIFIHFSCLSSFTWLLSYILFLGNEIKGEDHYYALSMSYYTTIGWGVPFIIVLISLIWRYKDFRDEDYCFMASDSNMEFAFIVPAVFLILVSYIMLFYVISIYLKAAKNPKRKLCLKVTRSDIRSCFVLLPVLGGTWLLATYAVKLRDMLLQSAFSICNGALGVMLFVFMYIWNEEIIQKRKEGKGFFPATSKEKRAKEEANKGRKRRKSVVGHIKTHPLWQVPPSTNPTETGTKVQHSTKRGTSSQVTAGTSSQVTAGTSSQVTAITSVHDMTQYEDSSANELYDDTVLP